MTSERLRAALEWATIRRDCDHGYHDVIHVAPAHFDGPACPDCSNARYADEMQRREPCQICAALAADRFHADHGADPCLICGTASGEQRRQTKGTPK